MSLLGELCAHIRTYAHTQGDLPAVLQPFNMILIKLSICRISRVAIADLTSFPQLFLGSLKRRKFYFAREMLAYEEGS